jgi:hypothetical protein
VPAFVIGMLLVPASPIYHPAWISRLGAVLMLVSMATTFTAVVVRHGSHRHPDPAEPFIAQRGSSRWLRPGTFRRHR